MYTVAILAGGRGTRLAPVTDDRPKALIDIDGTPFIEYQLRLLARKGIKRVVVCAGYLGEMIQTSVGDGQRFGLKVRYSFDGCQPLGTGGAIVKAGPKMLGHRFFVLYGDAYPECDFETVQRRFDDSGKPALMTVQAAGRHRANVAYADGLIEAYDKDRPNSAMGHFDYGLLAFDWQAIWYAMPGRTLTFDLAEMQQTLVKRRLMAGYEVAGPLYEVGSFRGIDEFQAHVVHG